MPFDLLCGSVIESQRARTSGISGMGERFLKRVVRCGLAFLLVLLVAEKVHAHGDHNLRESESERVEELGTLTSGEARTLTGSLRPEDRPSPVDTFHFSLSERLYIYVVSDAAYGLLSVCLPNYFCQSGNFSRATSGPFGRDALEGPFDPGRHHLQVKPRIEDGLEGEYAFTLMAVRDPDGVTVTPLPSRLSEGRAITHEVVLKSPPQEEATVTLKSSDPAVTVSPTTLTFARFGSPPWYDPQPITVSAVEDDNAVNEEVTITYQVGGYYDVERVAPATVTVIDNDEAAVRVTLTRLTLGEGETGTYEVDLTAKPEGNVHVTVASDDTSAVVVSGATLTFTADDWYTAQTVTVEAVEDGDAGHENVTITHDVSGYGRVTVTVTVTVIDNDEAGVRVTPTRLTLEEGETGTYEVVLTAEPEGYVEVTAASDDTSAVVVSGATLRFTADDWDTAQTVTVWAVEDDDARDENVTITHDVSGYGRVTAAAGVTVTVIDNDEAGVRVTPDKADVGGGGDGYLRSSFDGRTGSAMWR